MKCGLTGFSDFLDAEKEAVARMAKAAMEALRDVNSKEVDTIALIINDHEGSDEFTTEIWVNNVAVVNGAVKAGVRQCEARWLYEHWSPAAAKGVILPAGEGPARDRGRYYSLAVETIHEIRRQVPEMEETVFLVDNNHDYDSLVVDAIAAANPKGQAAEWLANPPPDCQSSV
jgi:hypothetical protein